MAAAEFPIFRDWVIVLDRKATELTAAECHLETPIRRSIVALSRDFLDEEGQLAFPDLGLSLFENKPGLSYSFVPDYRPEYVPEQLRRIATYSSH